MPQHVAVHGWSLTVRQTMLAIVVCAVGLASPTYLVAWLAVAFWWFLVAAAIYYPIVRRLVGLLAVVAILMIVSLAIRR